MFNKNKKVRSKISYINMKQCLSIFMFIYVIDHSEQTR